MDIRDEQSQRPTNNVHRLYGGDLVVETRLELESNRALLRASKGVRNILVGAAVLSIIKAADTPSLPWLGLFWFCAAGSLAANVAVANFQLAVASLGRSLKSIR